MQFYVICAQMNNYMIILKKFLKVVLTIEVVLALKVLISEVVLTIEVVLTFERAYNRARTVCNKGVHL